MKVLEKLGVCNSRTCFKVCKKIKGSYTNVVGLSLSDLYLMLKGIGFKKLEFFVKPIVIHTKTKCPGSSVGRASD